MASNTISMVTVMMTTLHIFRSTFCQFLFSHFDRIYISETTFNLSSLSIFIWNWKVEYGQSSEMDHGHMGGLEHWFVKFLITLSWSFLDSTCSVSLETMKQVLTLYRLLVSIMPFNQLRNDQLIWGHWPSPVIFILICLKYKFGANGLPIIVQFGPVWVLRFGLKMNTKVAFNTHHHHHPH